MAKSITKTVISKATCLSSPNASIGDMVSIKTGFPIKHFGNDNKGECRLTYALITSIPSVDEIREGVAPLYRDKDFEYSQKVKKNASEKEITRIVNFLRSKRAEEIKSWI